AVARDCGEGHHFEAARPVTASPTLAEVALEHSRDMAEHRKLGHPGSDGSAPADRVTRSGYVWRGTGENVASGQQTPDAVMKSWLASPGHCENIMEPRFTEMGVAFALAPEQNPNIYWTQVFATPR
ncbi:MAG TPA: CAP domain-containing protein, partial [Gammaproteobacteria bacterium]|nr:CAP domain-containing protein [Gammaproteobacteria bacterium]